jgi:hypothetical protein
MHPTPDMVSHSFVHDSGRSLMAAIGISHSLLAHVGCRDATADVCALFIGGLQVMIGG